MRKIVALLFLCSLGTLAAAQYNQNVYQQEEFIAAYCSDPGNNCWKLLPGISASKISVAQDGTLAVVKRGTTSTYVYNQTTGGWDALPFQATDIAAMDSTDIYFLGTGGIDQTTCTSLGIPSVLYWNGTSVIPLHGCLSQLSVGRDSTLRGTGLGTAWFMANPSQSTQWTEYYGTGWTYINSSTANEWCGIENGLLYSTSTGNTVPAAFAPQPTGSSGSVVACQINGSAPDKDILITWNQLGLQFYNDVNANAWNTIGYLPTFADFTAFGEGTVLQADTGGNVYLYNVYAGGWGVQITGSYNACPVPSNPCPPSGVTHNYNMQFNMPGGIGPHRSVSGKIAPTQDATNFADASDYTPNCSWTFSTPTDAGCKPTTVTGTMVCGLTGATLLAVSQPEITLTRSYDARIFDGSFQAFGYTATPVGAYLQANCGIDKTKGANGCATGTAPSCPYPGTEKLVDDTCVGSTTGGCSEATMETGLRNACGLRRPGGLVWAFQKLSGTWVINGKPKTICSGPFHTFTRKYPLQCQ